MADFTVTGEGQYSLTAAQSGVRLDVDHLRRERGELLCELTVFCDRAPKTVDGVLSVGTFNLSSVSARATRAKQLREQSDTELDFGALLEELCQRVIRAERTGTPARPLTAYDITDREPELIVDPDAGPLSLRLLKDHPVILFGDGGAGKSLIQLYALGRLAQQGLCTLLVDWELNGQEHHRRLRRIFGDALPVVHYLRADRPIGDEAERIRREVGRLGVDYIALDSVAFACGGAPEAAEQAAIYFRAIRHIGIGSLNLAHITKAENGDQKPFGSAFWANGARATYFVKATEAGFGVSAVGLLNRKANLTARRDYAHHLGFTDQAIDIHPIALDSVDELASGQSTWKRIQNTLRQTRKPLTIHELATALDAKADTIQKALKKSPAFQRLQSADGVVRWALATKEPAA